MSERKTIEFQPDRQVTYVLAGNQIHFYLPNDAKASAEDFVPIVRAIVSAEGINWQEYAWHHIHFDRERPNSQANYWLIDEVHLNPGDTGFWYGGFGCVMTATGVVRQGWGGLSLGVTQFIEELIKERLP